MSSSQTDRQTDTSAKMLNLSANLGSAIMNSNGATGVGGSGPGTGLSDGSSAGGGALPWKEHTLSEICVAPADVGDAVTCLLHTILFTRAPGPVRPSEATCHAFPSITYSLCAVGDVSRKVEHAVQSFEESIAASAAMGPPAPYGQSGGASGYFQQSSSLSSQQQQYGHRGRRGSGGALGIPSGGSAAGCLVVAFFERKVKKALFGLMSNEEKVLFEKWVIPVTVVAPASAYGALLCASVRAHLSRDCGLTGRIVSIDKESLEADAESALQNALLHVLSAVQTIEHIPNAMYDFEVRPVESRPGVDHFFRGLTSQQPHAHACSLVLDHVVWEHGGDAERQCVRPEPPERRKRPRVMA